jgi:hypothetical protein
LGQRQHSSNLQIVESTNSFAQKDEMNVFSFQLMVMIEPLGIDQRGAALALAIPGEDFLMTMGRYLVAQFRQSRMSIGRGTISLDEIAIRASYSTVNSVDTHIKC